VVAHQSPGNLVVSLVGPRQAGKTTLARMLASELTEPVHFFADERQQRKPGWRVSFIDVGGFSLHELQPADRCRARSPAVPRGSPSRVRVIDAPQQ